MNNVTIIGIDLAKRVFHAHGAHADGSAPLACRRREGNCLSEFF
ncbi:hypothetical protein [Mesorhizobium sp. LNHC229A00]|nr:hypothetical protein [Mesorhizobium sp. LNHC229A00]